MTNGVRPGAGGRGLVVSVSGEHRMVRGGPGRALGIRTRLRRKNTCLVDPVKLYFLTCFHVREFGVLPGFHIGGLLVVNVVVVVISVDLKLWSLSKEIATLLGVIKRSGATVTIFSVELDDFLLIRSDTMKLYRLKIS